MRAIKKRRVWWRKNQSIEHIDEDFLVEGRDYFKIRLIERNCPNQYVKLQYWRRSVIFKRIINIVLN
jgi:hypothetical protein